MGSAATQNAVRNSDNLDKRVFIPFRPFGTTHFNVMAVFAFRQATYGSGELRSIDEDEIRGYKSEAETSFHGRCFLPNPDLKLSGVRVNASGNSITFGPVRKRHPASVFTVTASKVTSPEDLRTLTSVTRPTLFTGSS